MTKNKGHKMRAEHASLAGYLREQLTPVQLQRVLLVSFNQWDFGIAALAEVGATLHTMGMEPQFAFWASKTPTKDVGWTTSPLIASALASPGRDQKLKKALVAFGLPKFAFHQPPIKRWKPISALAQPSVPIRSQIRALTYRDAPVGRAILQVNPDTDTPVTDDHLWPSAWIQASSRSYAYAYDQILALVEHKDISAMIVFNGRFLHDSAAVTAAETAGIPVLSYDKGGNDTDFDLTIDATHDWSALQHRMLKMYEEWPQDERDQVGSSWFEERSTHADPRNERFVESQNIGQGIERSDQKILVGYFSSSGDEISELDLDWSNYFYGQPEALQSLARACRELGYSLLVRTHPHKRMKPKRDVEDWLGAVAEARPDIHIDQFSPIDSYTLMKQVDVVVTYGSTTGVEAAHAQRPVIVLGPSAYDELGCATRVTNENELKSALEKRIVGHRAGAISYGLMMKRRGFSFEFVELNDEGIAQLCGVDFDEPRALVRQLSHVLTRIQRRVLTRN
jgi:hypothetical protein